jgi:hypothetical protein
LECIKVIGIADGADRTLRPKEASETAFAIIKASASKHGGGHTKNTGQTLRLLVIARSLERQNVTQRSKGKRK